MNKNNKFKLGLLVNEFFTDELKKYNGFGGYGNVARNYIARYLPSTDLEVETIIGVNDRPVKDEYILDGFKKVIFFPCRPSGVSLRAMFVWFMEKATRNPCYSTSAFIREQGYDGYLSLEMQGVSFEILRADDKGKVILWLRDPRPESDWVELDSMSISQTGYRPTEKVRALARNLQDEGRLIVITQGKFLESKGREFYGLDNELPIYYVPNPVEVDTEFQLSNHKKENSIVFLGRIDAVKRPWLYFEIAKKLPQYTFYVCGDSHEDDFEGIVKKYGHINNLKFMGHVEGEDKLQVLAKSKVLVNTSIHEAIPNSFLEALSYGCLVVSCQNPDNMTAMFGRAVNQVLGDGYAMVDPFCSAVSEIIENEPERQKLAAQAISYIREVHSVERFQKTLKDLIKEHLDSGAKK